MERFDVIVIGGGPAGVTAALRARELGAAVALVERGRMGGTCTNDGCVPTRVLAKAARLVRDAQQFEEYGLVGSPPGVDLPALIAHTQQTVYRLHEKKQLLDHLAEAGVRVLADAGAASFLDPHTLVVNGSQHLEGEKFILCTGGRARRLSFPGSELALTHSDVWSLSKLPGSMAIVGAAATGCQLASIFAAFGAKVWLLDVAPHILNGEDELVSHVMDRAFRERGVEVITNVDGVAQLQQDDAALQLCYAEAAESKLLSAEMVVLAVGWVGNVEELNLPAAGVDSERGYVVVDDSLRTSAHHIFAAGDVNGRMMFVQSATHEARIAAENAVLGNRHSFRHQVVPHGGFTDPEYGSVGLTEAQARQHGDSAVAVVPYSDLDRAVIDGRTEGFCKLIVSRDSHLILGAHVVGEQALEVVQIAAAGMAAGMRVEQLAELELAYPTFASIIGLAARQLVRELGLTPLAREWRSLAQLGERVAEWERGG
ncbi:MAG TPA: NAD(P)/FAD-dependent oxidoreductase [Anaerolineae bacterium]